MHRCRLDPTYKIITPLDLLHEHVVQDIISQGYTRKEALELLENDPDE